MSTRSLLLKMSYCKDAVVVHKVYKKIPLTVSRKLRQLHQECGVKGMDLVRQYPQYSKSNIYTHMVKDILNKEDEKRVFNPGRPKVVRGKCTINSKNEPCNTKKSYRTIPMEISIHMRYLHQDLGLSGKDIAKKYKKYSRASVYKHMIKPISGNAEDGRKNNTGRPAVLTQRDTRHILNKIPILRKERGDFTVDDIKKASGISESVSNQTVSRVLWKEGYKVRNKRRKGLLTGTDIKKRYNFAKYVKKNFAQDIWCKEIYFYLDGTGFTHKFNPCQSARRNNRTTWRKRSEGLSLYCTGAGSHEGTGGRVARFMVAIAYGKGVTMSEEYTERLNGSSFAQFVTKHFPPCFQKSVKPEGKLFLQDGDPSQNSGIALEALIAIGGTKFSIPARSPDLNPIGNFFHLTKRKLKYEALTNGITQETYSDFVARIQRTMLETPTKVIDNVIGSMNKRIDMVIKSKGQRIKY